MRGKVSCAAVLLCLLLALPPRAGAAERPRVQLRVDECVEVDHAEVQRLLGIELGAQLLGEEEMPDGTTKARVTCGATGAELHVDDPLTGKSLWRIVELGASPESVRPRLLALALAELLFASWTELEISLRAAPSGTPARVLLPGGRPLAPAEARRAASLVVRRKLRDGVAPDTGLRLLGVAGAQAFSGTGPLFGGGLRLAGDHRYHLGFATDLLAHHGQTRTALGDVVADSLSTSAALIFHKRVGRLGLRAGGGVRGRWRRGTPGSPPPRLGLRAGGGVRGGAAHLAGDPRDPVLGRGGTVWGAFGGPLGLIDTSLTLPRRVVIELALEGGYVLFPVIGRVAGARAVAVEGGWLGGQLGVGIGP